MKKFEIPAIDMIEIAVEDVITTSAFKDDTGGTDWDE